MSNRRRSIAYGKGVSNNVLSHKQGDTFAYSASLRTDAGGNKGTEGWSIRAQVRSRDTITNETTGEIEYIDEEVCELTFAWLDEIHGMFHLSATHEETSTWPVGNLYLDIEFTTHGGSVFSTPTVVLKVTGDNTK